MVGVGAGEWLTLRVDGASRGNPGPAAIGVVVEDGGERREIGEFIGFTTNNVAEYRALIRGLEEARARGAVRLRVFSDSQLLVRQLRGEYRIRDDRLADLAEEARRLMAAFAAVELHHVPREENSAADRLANAALDRQGREAGAGPPPGGNTATPRLAPAVVRPARPAARTVAVRLVDAFTELPLAGNPAGVVLDAEGLEEGDMQALARELGVSETVFVLPGGADAASAGGQAGDRWRFRYFTPAREVPLCGHATLAAVHLLAVEGRVRVPAGGRRLVVETGVGPRSVEVEALPDDGVGARGGGLASVRVWLELAPPRFRPFTGEPAELAAVLGLAPDHFHSVLQPALAYSGLWHLLVPVAAPEVLDLLRPDRGALAALNTSLGVHTTHVFAAPPSPPVASLAARDFAPALGIAEDPQTGTANGALAAWLAALGWLGAGAKAGAKQEGGSEAMPSAVGSPEAGLPTLPAGGHKGAGARGAARCWHLTVAQGAWVGRPGLVQVRVEGGGDAGPGHPDGEAWPARVWVGGRAAVSLRGEAYLPAAAARVGP